MFVSFYLSQLLKYIFHIFLVPIRLVGCSGNDLAIIIVKDLFGFD
jgi:hypothetical protein